MYPQGNVQQESVIGQDLTLEYLLKEWVTGQEIPRLNLNGCVVQER